MYESHMSSIRAGISTGTEFITASYTDKAVCSSYRFSSFSLALSLHTVALSSPAATSHDFPQLQPDLRWGLSC